MKDKQIILKNQINNFLRKEQLIKNEEYKKLEKPYLMKARKNLTIDSLLLKISEEEEIKKMLSLTSYFEMYDWVIIISYNLATSLIDSFPNSFGLLIIDEAHFLKDGKC